MRIKTILALLVILSCTREGAYILEKDDITVDVPDEGFVAEVDRLFRVTVTSVCDEGVEYLWTVDSQEASRMKNLEYMFSEAGWHTICLTASQGSISFDYEYTVTVSGDQQYPEGKSPFVTKVLEYRPAPGQFVNSIPKYEEGCTAQDMNARALECIAAGRRSLISLGGFGGSITVGFDHRIENREGLMDFRIPGNAYYGPDSSSGAEGGSCEPGIVMVARDEDGDGQPDEWFELRGSSYDSAEGEDWYDFMAARGGDMRTVPDYSVTYFRPSSEPDGKLEQYIRWEDSEGASGWLAKNTAHPQPYFPQWEEASSVTFTGRRLPANSYDPSGNGSYFVLFRFAWGYADNVPNTSDLSCFDISWAVDAQGNPVSLDGIDFVKVYTAVRQDNGWLGEVSTEMAGVEDLHLLGETVPVPAETLVR